MVVVAFLLDVKTANKFSSLKSTTHIRNGNLHKGWTKKKAKEGLPKEKEKKDGHKRKERKGGLKIKEKKMDKKRNKKKEDRNKICQEVCSEVNGQLASYSEKWGGGAGRLKCEGGRGRRRLAT